MARIFTILLYGLGVTTSYAQATLQSVWPLGVPLSYINWYSNNTYSVDSTGFWDEIHYGNSSALVFNDTNQLLFQSNCCKVVDKAGQIIQNGDTIVEPLYYTDYGITGNGISQGTIALPQDKDTWWIFNMSFSDSAWYDATHGTPSVYSPDRLYAAIVDIKANNGAGKVLAKKIPVYKGVMGDCRLTACRHANGRDWWLINHGWNNSVYNKWLVTPDSIYGVFRDTIGTLHQEPDIFGMAQFSLDGTMYAMGSSNGLVNIFDFDRCSGKFSNLRTIRNYIDTPWTMGNSVSYIDGLCISPSKRFIYLTNKKQLTQFDLDADNIDSSRVLLATVDSTYKNISPFFLLALTPHNTIMVSNYQGVIPFSHFHIIQYPDSAGIACHFQKESFEIPGSYDNIALPNLPNLKLGADTGSLCDTLRMGVPPSGDKAGLGVRCFPNPASDKVFIEVSDNLHYLGEITITDNLGRITYQNKNYDGAAVINVQQWTNGMYFYKLKTKSYEHAGKFIVQH